MVFGWLLRLQAATHSHHKERKESDPPRKLKKRRVPSLEGPALTTTRAKSVPNPQPRGRREVEAWIRESGSDAAVLGILGARDAAATDREFRPIPRIPSGTELFGVDEIAAMMRSHDTPLTNIAPPPVPPKDRGHRYPEPGPIARRYTEPSSSTQCPDRSRSTRRYMRPSPSTRYAELGLSHRRYQESSSSSQSEQPGPSTRQHRDRSRLPPSPSTLCPVVKRKPCHRPKQSDELVLANVKCVFQINPRSTARGVRLGESGTESARDVGSQRGRYNPGADLDNSDDDDGYMANLGGGSNGQRRELVVLSERARGKLPERPYNLQRLQREDATVGTSVEYCTVSQVPRGKGRMVSFSSDQEQEPLQVNEHRALGDADFEVVALSPAVDPGQRDALGILAGGQFPGGSAMSPTVEPVQRDALGILAGGQYADDSAMSLAAAALNDMRQEEDDEWMEMTRVSNASSRSSRPASPTPYAQDLTVRVPSARDDSEGDSSGSSDSSEWAAPLDQSEQSPTDTQFAEFSRDFGYIFAPQRLLSGGGPYSFDSLTGRMLLDVVRKGLCLAPDTEPSKIEQLLLSNVSILRHLYSNTVPHPKLRDEEVEVYTDFGQPVHFHAELLNSIQTLNWNDSTLRRVLDDFLVSPIATTQEAVEELRKYREGRIARMSLQMGGAPAVQEATREMREKKEEEKRRRSVRPQSLLRAPVFPDDCVDRTADSREGLQSQTALERPTIRTSGPIRVAQRSPLPQLGSQPAREGENVPEGEGEDAGSAVWRV